MHELGITRNIVAIVADAAAGRTVCKVTLEIGQLAGVMAEAIAFCFDVVARDTPLAGATLEIVRVSGRARCTPCGAEFDTPTLFTPCQCGSRAVHQLSGEELKIKHIEVEEAA
jgi:hydrogenase nickel incorporation protein HypA/HybF